MFTGLYAIKLIPFDFDEKCVPLDARNVHEIILGSLSHVLQGLDGRERCESQMEHAQSRAKERENVCAFYSFLNVKRRICCD